MNKVMRILLIATFAWIATAILTTAAIVKAVALDPFDWDELD
jgi:hypothetical protein